MILCKVCKNAKIYFIICGFLSTMWILCRVIIKPSRSTYPCVRAAIPIASGFILYLIGVNASVLSYKLASKYTQQTKR